MATAMEIDPFGTTSITRQILPPLPQFSGQKSEYPAWKNTLLAKLRVDGIRMGGEVGQIAAVMLAMKGDAAKLTNHTINLELSKEFPSIDVIKAYLDSIFADPERQRRAHDEWTRLRQGRSTFDAFYADFERLMVEAGGNAWAEDIKIRALQNAVSAELSQATLSVETPSNLRDLVRVYRRVWENLQRSKAPRFIYVDQGPPGQQQQVDPMDIDVPGSFPVARKPARQAPPGPLPDDAQLQGKRAKWCSREEFDRRRAAGACTRCGRIGCHTRRCPLLPAANPNGRRVLPPAAQSNYIAPSLDDVVEDALKEDTLDSGKVPAQ